MSATDKPTERAPIWTDDEIERFVRMRISLAYKPDHGVASIRDTCAGLLRHMRDDVKAKLTSGELRVVKPVTYDRGGCMTCGNSDDYGTAWRGWVYCPGCGGPITERLETPKREPPR